MPGQIDKVYLFDNGEFIRIVSTDKAENANTPRVKQTYNIDY